MNAGKEYHDDGAALLKAVTSDIVFSVTPVLS